MQYDILTNSILLKLVKEGLKNVIHKSTRIAKVEAIATKERMVLFPPASFLLNLFTPVWLMWQSCYSVLSVAMACALCYLSWDGWGVVGEQLMSHGKGGQAIQQSPLQTVLSVWKWLSTCVYCTSPIFSSLRQVCVSA